MALLNQSTQVWSQLPKFFATLREGTAPPSFTRQFLKDIGYKSSNHHQLIPLLKGLGFLTSDGTPTDRYREFLDETKWKQVLAQAIREAYDDVFVLKAKPGPSDLHVIAGKYKSTYNLSDVQAERSARTFLGLLALADPQALYTDANPKRSSQPTASDRHDEGPPIDNPIGVGTLELRRNADVGLHYNIQIHLPATKDIEVYNAIFRSIRDHLIE